MLTTFVVELILIISVFVRKHLSVTGRIAGLILICLATFQLAEYMICTDGHQLLWARIGFGAITLLPVLGLNLIASFTDRKYFIISGYLLAGTVLLMLVLIPESVVSAFCGGNYIIFHSSSDFAWPYIGYYFSLLVLGLFEMFKEILKLPARNTKRRILMWIGVGYLSFLIPWGVIYIYLNQTRGSIASVMCGFAVIFALILGLRVVPLAEKKS